MARLQPSDDGVKRRGVLHLFVSTYFFAGSYTSAYGYTSSAARLRSIRTGRTQHSAVSYDFCTLLALRNGGCSVPVPLPASGLTFIIVALDAGRRRTPWA